MSIQYISISFIEVIFPLCVVIWLEAKGRVRNESLQGGYNQRGHRNKIRLHLWHLSSNHRGLKLHLLRLGEGSKQKHGKIELLIIWFQDAPARTGGECDSESFTWLAISAPANTVPEQQWLQLAASKSSRDIDVEFDLPSFWDLNLSRVSRRGGQMSVVSASGLARRCVAHPTAWHSPSAVRPRLGRSAPSRNARPRPNTVQIESNRFTQSGASVYTCEFRFKCFSSGPSPSTPSVARIFSIPARAQSIGATWYPCQ